MEQPQTPTHRPPPVLRWLDLVPLAWLALVLAAYAALVFSSPPGPERPTGVLQAERTALPLLAALCLTGIIRYLCLRNTRATEDAPANVGTAAPQDSR
jgi:hypothetical protein